MAKYLLLFTISVFLLQSIVGEYEIVNDKIVSNFIFIVKGQTNRSTSGCSVPLCPPRNNTTSSCGSNNQLCYAYQVPLTNQTFCAPSVSCSLF
jgi:hypothetical protein